VYVYIFALSNEEIQPRARGVFRRCARGSCERVPARLVLYICAFELKI
jgi:hypothetical protein